MKAQCGREALVEAWGLVSGAVPYRSPRPVLQNIKMVASPDGSHLMALDLEVGVTVRMLGCEVEESGVCLLPQTFGRIIQANDDAELSIETVETGVDVAGHHSHWTLPSEDPSLFPDVPTFDPTAWMSVAAVDLRRLIVRTVFATDVESTRYALGGCLVERTDDTMAFVGTDGRRLARQVVVAEHHGADEPVTSQMVVPSRTLKLLLKHLDGTGNVRMALQGNSSVLFDTGQATLYSRLVEGRYPNFQSVIPADHKVAIPLEVGPLKAAVQQAGIVTSEESRGVDFTFGSGSLRLSSQSADRGKSIVEIPIPYDGEPILVTMDPQYLVDALKPLDDGDELACRLTDAKNAVVLASEALGWIYVLMPLTRDR